MNLKLESIGCIEFGNNQFYEVMVEERFVVVNVHFQHDLFPVWVIDHNDDQNDESAYIPMSELVAQVAKDQTHHLNTVVIQLGDLLNSKLGR